MFSMMWFGLLIPIVILGCLLIVPKWRHSLVWWEVVLPIVVTITTIVICQTIAVNSAKEDKEYWGAMGVTVTHQEPFAYDSECSESFPCGESCDSKGNCSKVYCIRYVHCVQSSPRQCTLYDNNGNGTGISCGIYEQLSKRWKMHNYKKEIVITHSSGYTTHGDKYNRPNHGNKHRVDWDNDWATSEPMVLEKTYENRVQTLSHWGNISEKQKKEYELFEYPEVYGWTTRTVMTNKPPYFHQADKYLSYLNGILNTPQKGFKKIRIWILVWYDQSQEVAEYQKKYWKNGNKNEFIIMIGANKEQEIIWAEVMSWTEKDDLMIEVRDHLNIDFKQQSQLYSGKLTDEDLVKFSMWLEDKLQKKYVKPSFHKYDFIAVQPSINSLIISYGIILLINIAVAVFVVKNQFYTNTRKKYGR